MICLWLSSWYLRCWLKKRQDFSGLYHVFICYYFLNITFIAALFEIVSHLIILIFILFWSNEIAIICLFIKFVILLLKDWYEILCPCLLGWCHVTNYRDVIKISKVCTLESSIVFKISWIPIILNDAILNLILIVLGLIVSVQVSPCAREFSIFLSPVIGLLCNYINWNFLKDI